MLLYISGPYSGATAENILAARKVAVSVWRAGHAAICPHLNTANFEIDAPEVTYDDYIKGDLLMVERCDGLVMIPGWEKSKGAGLELEHAIKHGKPVWDFPVLPPAEPTFKPDNILEEANRLTSTDRKNTYGHPITHFSRTIALMNALLSDYLSKPLTVDLWPKFLILDKVSRSMSTYKRDNMVDVAGYARTHEMVMEELERRNHAPSK